MQRSTPPGITCSHTALPHQRKIFTRLTSGGAGGGGANQGAGAAGAPLPADPHRQRALRGRRCTGPAQAARRSAPLPTFVLHFWCPTVRSVRMRSRTLNQHTSPCQLACDSCNLWPVCRAAQQEGAYRQNKSHPPSGVSAPPSGSSEGRAVLVGPPPLTNLLVSEIIAAEQARFGVLVHATHAILVRGPMRPH